MTDGNHASAAMNLTEMLKHLGWGTGFKLPIANEENKALERALEMKQTKLMQVTQELQETKLAVDNSSSFYKHLNTKIQHMKDVEAAKRGQMEKEKNFYSLSSRDKAKTNEELKLLQKKIAFLKERNDTTERLMNRRKDALGELVDTINFDKKAIKEYELKFTKEDAYMKLMEEFGDVDNEKYEQCKKEYQQLGEKIIYSRMRCNQTIQESEIMEGELEALAKRFRKAHLERNVFIENWKNTLQALETRDKEILDMSYEYKKASLYFKRANDLLQKQEAFYSNIQNQSRAYEIDLGRVERAIGSLQLRKKDEEGATDDLADGVAELASYIYKIEKEIKTLAKQFKSLSVNTAEWKGKIDKLKKEVEALREKYEATLGQSESSTEQVTQLQDFLDNEERKTEGLMKELMKQTNYKSQRQRQVNELNYEMLGIEAEARNLKSCIAHAKRKCLENGDIIIRVKSIAYGLDIQCMSLTSKVRGLENPSALYTKDDYTHLIRQISEMKSTYQEHLKTGQMLKDHTFHCDNLITVYQKDISKERHQRHTYDRDLHKLGMEIRKIVKDDESSMEEIKDVGLTNSLLNVQLKRMINSIQQYEDKMLDLEQERVTLHAVVNSRQKDIQVYQALLTTKRRQLLDENQKLKGRIHDVNNDATARKRKYEMIMFQMWGGSGGGGQEEKKEEENKSEAYYIVKMAQERAFYKKEGDKWDAQVKEAEKIVEGLQNTLALMVSTNEAFKDSLRPAAENTKEGRQLQELKEQEYEAAHLLKKAKERRIQCMDKLKEVQQHLDNSLAQKNQLEHGVMERQYELKSLIVEITGQKEKIQRATLQANKVIKELSRIDTLDTELLKNDLRLRVTREKYEFAVSTLERLLSIYPYLGETTLAILNEKGMTALRDKLVRRVIGSTILSGSTTPVESMRASPNASGRSSSIAGVRRSTKRSAYAQSLMSKAHTVPEHAASRMQKSVVFGTLTTSPSIQKMLKNIRGGMDEAKKKKDEDEEQRKTKLYSSRTGAKAVTAKNTAAPGISFGELRKVLKDVVSEQQKLQDEVDKMTEDDNHLPPAPAPSVIDRTSVQTAEIIELVDNKDRFNDGDISSRGSPTPGSLNSPQ